MTMFINIAGPAARLIIFGLLLPLVTACTKSTSVGASGADAAAPATNDFPTLARVEYVLQCMQQHGGQNYNTLYGCTCSVDKVASQLNYAEFSEAQTFTYLRSTPGEAGGLFRDPPRSKVLRERFQEARTLAEQACFPAHG